MAENTTFAGGLDRDFVQTVPGGGETDILKKKEDRSDEISTDVTKGFPEEDSKDEGIGSFEVVTVSSEAVPAERGDYDSEAAKIEEGKPQLSVENELTGQTVSKVGDEKEDGASKTRKRKADFRESEDSEDDETDSEDSETSEETDETETDESDSTSTSTTDEQVCEKKENGASKVTSQTEDGGKKLTSMDTTAPALQAEDNKTAAFTTEESSSGTLRRRKQKSREQERSESETKGDKSAKQKPNAHLEEETNLPIIIVTVACCVALVLYAVLNRSANSATNKIGGRTALHGAAKKGDVSKLVRLLAPKDIDINKQDDYGDTALMLAIRNKQEDAAILLLTEGADHSLFNVRGEAAIHEVASNGLDTLITNMLKYGADLELQSRDGWTPLMKAVRAEELVTVRALLEKGHVNPNTRSDSGGLSALHLAAQKNPSMLNALVKAGGNINIKDDIFGVTPLHVAASECNMQTARELLRKGADDQIEAKDGTRPRHVIGKKVHKSHVKNAQCDGVKRLLMA